MCAAFVFFAYCLKEWSLKRGVLFSVLKVFFKITIFFEYSV